MKILLVTRFRERHKTCRYEAGESMLQGLEEAGIDYDIYPPWEPFTGNLDDYDAVLIWAYQGKRKNIQFWARRFEAVCRAAGLPIINSIDGCFYTHTTSLKRWKEAGIPCASYQRFEKFEDINLRYPMILRTDGLHEGKNTHLVHTPEEARQTIEANYQAYITSHRKDKEIRLLDLAIEFHDVTAPDGFCHKRRTIVVGDTLIHREHSVSEGWLVNLENRTKGEYIQQLNRDFFENGDEDREILLKAARALGSDVVALDYTKLANGEFMFWEGNRHFKMYGNKPFGPGDINPATGRTYEEMDAVDREVGRAIVRMLREVTEKTFA